MDKKNILFICQYFYPETFRGNDIAFHWAEKGHNVHVVTGIPNYPQGSFFVGYNWFKKRAENIKGVKVTRLPIIPRKNSKIMLILNYFSYLILSCIYIFFHALFNHYDCVFVQQLSPVTMSTSGIIYKKIRKVPLYTWVLDLWPDSLSAAGGINNRHVLNFFDFFVKKEYKYSDQLLISSKSFECNILNYGPYNDKIIYYPQWADDNLDVNYNDILPQLPDGFIVMFAGAIGEAHGFETNMQAALLTKNHKNIKWVILGDGRKLDWVRNFVKDNDLGETVYILGRYPVETMSYFFNRADVMLVSLSDSPLYNLYAPAKISSYLAAGKPIIAILNGEGQEVINDANCGISLSAGDYIGLANSVINCSLMDKEKLNQLGKNGRAYYEKNFCKDTSLEKIDRIMSL